MNNSPGSTACFILINTNLASVLVNVYLLHKTESLLKIVRVNSCNSPVFNRAFAVPHSEAAIVA